MQKQGDRFRTPADGYILFCTILRDACALELLAGQYALDLGFRV